MEASFWHRKWESNEIGFHQDQVNPFLLRYFSHLGLAAGSRVFVPLCGKTLDIHWLLAQGYRILGVELSELAVTQLFDELGLLPTIHPFEQFKSYEAENICIYVGDIFAILPTQFGDIAAIYDRAALVALPEAIRQRYAQLLQTLSAKNSLPPPQLLITLDYDQSLVAGPPFSVTALQINRLYGDNYHLRCLDYQDMPDGLKGKYPVRESVYFLEPQ